MFAVPFNDTSQAGREVLDRDHHVLPGRSAARFGLLNQRHLRTALYTVGAEVDCRPVDDGAQVFPGEIHQQHGESGCLQPAQAEHRHQLLHPAECAKSIRQLTTGKAGQGSGAIENIERFAHPPLGTARWQLAAAIPGQQVAACADPVSRPADVTTGCSEDLLPLGVGVGEHLRQRSTVQSAFADGPPDFRPQRVILPHQPPQLVDPVMERGWGQRQSEGSDVRDGDLLWPGRRRLCRSQDGSKRPDDIEVAVGRADLLGAATWAGGTGEGRGQPHLKFKVERQGGEVEGLRAPTVLLGEEHRARLRRDHQPVGRLPVSSWQDRPAASLSHRSAPPPTAKAETDAACRTRPLSAAALCSSASTAACSSPSSRDRM